MIRCSSCKQSHWVYARAGNSNVFEWLTGLTSYRCLACRRRGWHRSHRTSPAFEALRFGVDAVLKDRRAIGALAGAIVLGVGMGAAVLLSGTTGSPDREHVEVAKPPARHTISQGTADALTAESGLRAEVRTPPAPHLADRDPAATPTAGDVRPAVTSTGGDLRPAAPPAAATPVAPNATRVVAPAMATARATRDRQPPPAPAPRVRQQPQSTARPAVARARRVPAPALPKFHGTLAVRSEPRGALVSVDGRVVGATPLRLKAVPAGSRVVRIESEGYERWSSAARVVANQETSIVATLQRGSSQ
jgi:hypothetical protein